MNKNDNRFTEALASALHKMVERERSGAVDCYGWNYPNSSLRITASAWASTAT